MDSSSRNNISDNTSTISDSSKKRGRPKKKVKLSKVEQLKQIQSQNRRILRSGKWTSLTQEVATTVTPTKNKFKGLNNDVNISVMDTTEFTSTQQPDIEVKKRYIPPLVIQGMNFNDLIVLLKQYNITNYKIKLISVGIKVTLSDTEMNDKLKKILLDKKIEYFTFSNRDTNPLKMILTGLPTFKIEELETELTGCGIDADSILEILPLQHKEPRTYNVHKNVNYLIKFDKTKINMQTVNKIKSLFSIIIRWFPYVNYRSGPTQCRRCQMYGHGTSHCSRLQRCLKCGGNHPAEDCLITELKCANCGKEHEANSKACDNRSKYVAIRENISINRQLQHLNQKPNALSSIHNKKSGNVILNDSNFPTLKKSNQNSVHQHFYKHFSSSQPTSSVNPRIQQVQSTFTRSQPAPSSSNAYINNSSENLFTFEELTSLISDVTQKISLCTTRQQQFEVIMKLSLQYLGQLAPSSF